MKPLASERTYVRSYCPSCGKHCYASKRAARRAAKRIYPGVHMSFYECKGSPEFFHMSSEPERKKKRPSIQVQYRERRMMEREESFVETALNEMYDKAVKDKVAPVFTVEGKEWDEWSDLEETFPEDMGISPSQGDFVLTTEEAAQILAALEGE